MMILEVWIKILLVFDMIDLQSNGISSVVFVSSCNLAGWAVAGTGLYYTREK